MLEVILGVVLFVVLVRFFTQWSEYSRKVEEVLSVSRPKPKRKYTKNPANPRWQAKV